MRGLRGFVQNPTQTSQWLTFSIHSSEPHYWIQMVGLKAEELEWTILQVHNIHCQCSESFYSFMIIVRDEKKTPRELLAVSNQDRLKKIF